MLQWIEQVRSVSFSFDKKLTGCVESPVTSTRVSSPVGDENQPPLPVPPPRQVGAQRCRPRVPLRDRSIPSGGVASRNRRDLRRGIHLETNRRIRREARQFLAQHGRELPIELLD